MGASLWTQAQDRILIDCARRGLSASTTGKKLGVSRNAAISRGNRIGVRFHSQVHGKAKGWKPEKDPKIITENRKNVPGASLMRILAKSYIRPPTPPKPAEPIYLGARPWETRQFGECCWPLGEGSDIWSCCKPVSPESQFGWCEEHMAKGLDPREYSSSDRRRFEKDFLRQAAR